MGHFARQRPSGQSGNQNGLAGQQKAFNPLDKTKLRVNHLAMNKQNIPPDVAKITRLQDLSHVNKLLDDGWVLLGIVYTRHQNSEGAEIGFYDEETYIIGLSRKRKNPK